MQNGIDIVYIPRIEKSLKRKRFFEEIFGDFEKEELKKRNMPLESIAAAFAAKEAFGKSLGVGLQGFSLCEVQCLHRENGAPYLYLTGKAKALAEEKDFDFSLSISHDGDYAVAMVTAFQKGK